VRNTSQDAGGDPERHRYRRGTASGAPPDIPPAIVDKMVAQAVEKCRTIEGGRSIGRAGCGGSRGAGLIASVGALLLVIGPEFCVRASALVVLSKSAGGEPVRDYCSPAMPSQGSDQSTAARLAGFRTERRRVGEGRRRNSRAC
jgi:hypothetical protein